MAAKMNRESFLRMLHTNLIKICWCITVIQK